MKYLLLLLVIFSTIFSMQKGIKETTYIFEKVVVNDNSSSSDLDDKRRCSICFERYNNKEENNKRVDILCDAQRNIYHRYCKQCITDWIKKDNSCPTCKRPIKLKDASDSDYFFSIIAYLKKLCCCE